MVPVLKISMWALVKSLFEDNPAKSGTVRIPLDKMISKSDFKRLKLIAKDVKKSKLRPYIMNFLSFKNDKDKELYSSIRKQNILVVDDVTTSGSTLSEILRTLRIVNEDNKITIFSLIGRKDLMAEAV